MRFLDRWPVYNHRGPQQKAKYSKQDTTKKYPESSLNKTCGNYPVLPILKKTTIWYLSNRSICSKWSRNRKALSKRFLETTNTNAFFISAMSTGINFNSAFRRNCGSVSHRTDCWSTSTCTYSVKAKKITLTESRPEPKWAVRSISRPERMTRVSLPR